MDLIRSAGAGDLDAVSRELQLARQSVNFQDPVRYEIRSTVRSYSNHAGRSDGVTPCGNRRS